MFFLLIIFHLFANDVVVQSTKTPQVSYQKYLMEEPRRQSFIDFYQSKDKDLSNRLYEKLRLAQFEFINGDLNEAKQKFADLITHQHQTDWELKEQEAIQYALFRMAHLERNKELRRSWLQKAATFNPNIKMNKKLFPPPLVKEYQGIVKQQKQNVWPLPENADQFDKILVNGIAFSAKSGFIKTINGIKRISFLSNKYLPFHYVVSIDQLEKVKLPIRPIAQGPCNQPTFDTSLPETNVFKLFTENCQNKLPTTMTQINKPIQPKNVNKKSNSFWQSKWFWIGASVVVAGITMSQLQKPSSSPPQTAPPSPDPPPAAQPIPHFTNQ